MAKLQLQHQQLQVELQEVRALMTIKTTRGSDKCECRMPSGYVAGVMLAVSQFRVCMFGTGLRPN